MPGPFVEAWSNGREAGQRGEPVGANPHPRGTELAGHWADGWRDASRERLRSMTTPDDAPPGSGTGSTPRGT